MKIRDITPEALPPHLRDQLVIWMREDPESLMGYLRPGCVFLLADISLTPGSNVDEVVSRLASGIHSAASGSQPFWSTHDMDIVLPGKCMTIRKGMVSCEPRDCSTQILSVSHVATTGDAFSLVCKGWSSNYSTLYGRSNGQFFSLAIESATPMKGSDATLVSTRMPACMELGVVSLEIVTEVPGQRMKISEAVPVMLTDDAEIAEEVCTVVRPMSPSTASLLSILKDVSTLLHSPEDCAVETCVSLAKLAASRGWGSLLNEAMDASLEHVTVFEFLKMCEGNGHGLLTMAVLSKSADVLKQVLAMHPDEEQEFSDHLSCQDVDDGMSALHWAAAQSDGIAVAQLTQRAPEQVERMMTALKTKHELTPSDLLAKADTIIPEQPAASSSSSMAFQSSHSYDMLLKGSIALAAVLGTAARLEGVHTGWVGIFMLLGIVAATVSIVHRYILATVRAVASDLSLRPPLDYSVSPWITFTSQLASSQFAKYVAARGSSVNVMAIAGAVVSIIRVPYLRSVEYGQNDAFVMFSRGSNVFGLVLCVSFMTSAGKVPVRLLLSLLAVHFGVTVMMLGWIPLSTGLSLDELPGYSAPLAMSVACAGTALASSFSALETTGCMSVLPAFLFASVCLPMVSLGVRQTSILLGLLQALMVVPVCWLVHASRRGTQMRSFLKQQAKTTG